MKLRSSVEYEEAIDKVTTENWDLQDRICKMEMENTSLREQVKGAHELQQRMQTSGNEELRRAWDKVTAAEKEQERIENNYEHAQQTIRQLNANMELAKQEVEKTKKVLVSEEHLARKLVQLCDENNKLRSDICTLKEQEKAACEIMNAKLEKTPEYQAYQTQVTRLLDQMRRYDCQKAMTTVGDEKIPDCGICLSCQLKQTKRILEQTAENLKKRNYEVDSLTAQTVESAQAKEEQVKLVKQYTTENRHLKHILRLLRDTMGEITVAWPWQRKALAERALKDRLFYLQVNHLNGDC